MRSLDKNFITPVLRAEGLVKLNNDGFMMTRSLAENYPYSRVYKAALRGARVEWLALVEGLESGEVPPLPALQYLLAKLINHAADFNKLADATLAALQIALSKGHLATTASVELFVKQHMAESNYAARTMEIAMHALMQSIDEMGFLGGASVQPLSQMRNANKKHGNIGDIELLEGRNIVEAWDTKFGKTYLREELEELAEKLETHEAVVHAGFVTSEPPQLLPEIVSRTIELEAIYGVRITLLTLTQWVAWQVERVMLVDATVEPELARRWITAYAESLAQKRPTQAPIDEPCYQWLETLNRLLTKRFTTTI